MNDETKPVVTVKVEIEVGKETKELVDALADLVEDIRAKKDMSLIAAENLAGLLKAVEGVDQLDDEMKSSARNSSGAYAALKIADAIAPSK